MLLMRALGQGSGLKSVTALGFHAVNRGRVAVDPGAGVSTGDRDAERNGTAPHATQNETKSPLSRVLLRPPMRSVRMLLLVPAAADPHPGCLPSLRAIFRRTSLALLVGRFRAEDLDDLLHEQDSPIPLQQAEGYAEEPRRKHHSV